MLAFKTKHELINYLLTTKDGQVKVKLVERGISDVLQIAKMSGLKNPEIVEYVLTEQGEAFAVELLLHSDNYSFRVEIKFIKRWYPSHLLN